MYQVLVQALYHNPSSGRMLIAAITETSAAVTVTPGDPLSLFSGTCKYTYTCSVLYRIRRLLVVSYVQYFHVNVILVNKLVLHDIFTYIVSEISLLCVLCLLFAQTTAGVPSAPNISLVDNILSWLSPNDNGESILRYTVILRLEKCKYVLYIMY